MGDPVRLPSWILGSSLFLASLLAPGAASALGLVADGRSVSSFYRNDAEGLLFDETFVPNAPFTLFDVDARQASHQSSIVVSDDGRTLTALGSGTASAFHFDNHDEFLGEGDSQFEIRFRIDGEATVHLSGSLGAGDEFSGGYAFLSTDDGSLLFWVSTVDESALDFDFEDVLPAGEYQANVSAEASATPWGCCDSSGTRFSMQLVVADTVPEPAPLALVGLGLAALGARRRRPC